MTRPVRQLKFGHGLLLNLGASLVGAAPNIKFPAADSVRCTLAAICKAKQAIPVFMCCLNARKHQQRRDTFMGIFRPKDQKLVELTLQRLSQQDEWNDIFATKLIEILDKLDRSRLGAAQRELDRARFWTVVTGCAASASCLCLVVAWWFDDRPVHSAPLIGAGLLAITAAFCSVMAAVSK